MKTDIQIQKDVMDELKWHPYLNDSQIGVTVKNGIATLSGQVDTYSKKLMAEELTKNINGVKAVAEEITIGILPGIKKTDTEIAEAVLNALKWHTGVQEEKIKIKVDDGIVWLEGEVDWEYERTNAKSAIQYLTGVRSVINAIKIKTTSTPLDLKQKITAAFIRSASIDAENISATIKDNIVILKGTVRSLAEKEDAEITAWKAPGINNVENLIRVDMPEYSFEE